MTAATVPKLTPLQLKMLLTRSAGFLYTPVQTNNREPLPSQRAFPASTCVASPKRRKDGDTEADFHRLSVCIHRVLGGSCPKHAYRNREGPKRRGPAGGGRRSQQPCADREVAFDHHG